MKNIKQAIRNNELLIGTFSICSHPAVIELLGFAKFDFVVIDTEHGAAAPSSLELENLIRAAYAADIAPLVRVNEVQQGMIEKAHDTVIDMPVLYFTQLIGLAMGISEKELELDKNMVSTSKLVDSIGRGETKVEVKGATTEVTKAEEAEAAE